MQRFSRRDLIARGTALAGSAALAASGAPMPQTATLAATARTSPERMGILSYSFLGLFRTGMMDVFGFLETTKHRYQLSDANIWNGMLTSTNEDYLKKVREALDEREITLAVLTCDDCHIWDEDAEVRKKNKANALAHLNAGRILGAQFVRIDAGGTQGGKEFSNQAYDAINQQYREYADYARNNGFRMGPENHWGPEGIWANMQRIYKSMNNHPGFGLSVQMLSWQGTPEEKDIADKESAPWVAAVHMDYNLCTSDRLVEKMSLLRNAGYKGSWVVEHHGGTNEYAEVAVQLTRVRSVLQSWRTGGTGQPGGRGSGSGGRSQASGGRG
jgi:sugar phosphate isomerase/epimerase